MKKFLKKYGFMIIVFIALSVFFIRSAISSNNIIINQINDNLNSREYCLNLNTTNEILKESCADILSLEPMTYLKNFYVLISNIKLNFLFKFNLYLIFVVVVPIAFIVCSQLKNNYMKNYLMRGTYKNFRRNIFKSAYSSIWIFLSSISILLIFCAIITQNFNNVLPSENYIAWNSTVTSNPIFFSIFYLFHIFCYSFTYANIFLIGARKNHNPIIAILVTFLIIFGIELLLESVIFNLLNYIFPHSDYGILFNLMNSITFNEQFGLMPTLLIGIFWAIFFYLIARLCYKDQEKLFIDCEKNK